MDKSNAVSVFKANQLSEEARTLMASVADTLRSLGFEVHDHRRMLYATMDHDNLSLQLNYFAHHSTVTCQLSGLGMYTQLFGEYKIASSEELRFLVVANITITKNYPQLHSKR